MKPRFEKIEGVISHLSTTSTVSGDVKRGKGKVSTSHRSNFRVDGKPAVFSDTINIADGDHVTLMGQMYRGEFHARAIRNDETGVVYGGPTTIMYVLGGFLALVGIPAVVVFIGLLMVPVGMWVIYEGYKNKSAMENLAHRT